MRDIKITIPAGETSYQSVSMRAWHVRSIETDDVVKLVTQEQGALLLHTGQQVELDDSVQGFELINQSAVPVALHLQVAGKASIGSKKNSGESNSNGGAAVDQTARDAAARAQLEVDAVEVEADSALDAANQALLLAQSASESHTIVQALSDSGRMTSSTANIVTIPAGSETAAVSFPAYSANIQSESFHRFIHNNTDNGGSRGVMSPLIGSLLAAMGRVGSLARYGVEFAIVERRVVASGAVGRVTLGGGDYFLLSGLNELVGPDSGQTWSMWVYSENANENLVRANTGTVRVNGGEPEAEGVVGLPAGWVHLQYQLNSAAGYIGPSTRLYGQHNTVHAVGLVVLDRSLRKLPVHTSPVIYT